jgi:hypothetical protein
MVKAHWAAKQRPELPDAREWSTTLALALIQAMLGQRPVAHAIRQKCALAMVTGDRFVTVGGTVELG